MCNFEVSMTVNMRRLHVSFQCIAVISFDSDTFVAFCLLFYLLYESGKFICLFVWFFIESEHNVCVYDFGIFIFLLIYHHSYVCTFCQHSKHMFIIISQPRGVNSVFSSKFIEKKKTKRLSAPNYCVAFRNFDIFFCTFLALFEIIKEHVSSMLNVHFSISLISVERVCVCVTA